MTDLASLMGQHKDLSEEDQKKAGQAIAGKMEPRHYDFLKALTAMLKEEKINIHNPETFFKKETYDELDAGARSKVDLATVNIADLLRHIAEFYLSKKTPDESPQLQTMIEQLWTMKERVEKQYGDVYIF